MQKQESDIIFALATAPTPAALAVIRVSGTGAIAAVAKAFDRPGRLVESPGGRVHFGRIVVPAHGTPVDEVLVTVFRPTAGYTGEEAVEISCHGSLAGVRRIQDILSGLGLRPAQPGEFTLRAFLNGKLDLSKAEAVAELVESQTVEAHSLAMRRLSGGITHAVDSLKERLVQVLAAVEVGLDYAEDEIDEAAGPDLARVRALAADIEALAGTYTTGRLYQEGARVAIVGPTNAGKSSLFNALLKEDRAIVSPHRGTTRDVVEAAAALDGLPVRLFDTAGRRESGEEVELEGIRRAEALEAEADLLIFVVDGNDPEAAAVLAGAQNATAPPEANSGVPGAGAQPAPTAGTPISGGPEAGTTAAPEGGDPGVPGGGARRVPVIGVWNKCDLSSAPAPPDGAVGTSATTGAGLAELARAVKSALVAARGAETAAPAGEQSVVVGNARQEQLLRRAAAAVGAYAAEAEAGIAPDLAVLHLQEALSSLGEITGEVSSDDVLEAVFSGFCVGK